VPGERGATGQGRGGIAVSAPVSDGQRGFRVTCEDLATGQTQTMDVVAGDYMLIPFAPCHLHHTQRHANGTAILTLKDHRPVTRVTR
jgi:hypothetical protein